AEGASRRSEIRNPSDIRTPQPEIRNDEAEHPSLAAELGLMGFSVLIAVAGILIARKFYVTSPEIAERLATQYAGAHRTLSNKYYVDELYAATVLSRTMN